MPVSPCWFCICSACNARKCPKVSKFNRCKWCLIENGHKPTFDCDYFESRFKRFAFKVRPRDKRPLERIESKLDELLRRSEK